MAPRWRSFIEYRRSYVADRWWMLAALLVGVGGGVLMPVGRWWASMLGWLVVLAGFGLIGVGLYRGPRGRA